MKELIKKEPEISIEIPQEPVLPAMISFAEADVSTRYDDIYEIKTPDLIVHVRWIDGAYEFICQNGVTLRIQILSPAIIRLRYTPDGIFPSDHSYALAPDFQAEKVVVTLHEHEHEYLLLSANLQIVVTKEGMRVRFFDLNDRVICEDAQGYSAQRTVLKGWCEMKIEKKCHRKEVFLGLGDKGCSTNMAGKRFENWCTDAYAFGRDTDPMYRAIPFYYSLYQGLAYGIFLDNTYKSFFDFDADAQGVSSFSTSGGELNYYFIYGPELLDVSRGYARLTGKHALPPIWALGYHQCRWSYYPEDIVQALADKFRALEIPCDAIYLDIDYMDGYRCFTWNKEHFPDPGQMYRDLREKGFETIAMIDPGIKEDPEYAVYLEGMSQNRFLKTADGDVVKAPVWPGFCAFPDFTEPETRRWWGELYREMYVEMGLSGFWNDMNEPAVFHVNHKTLPDHVLHAGDGHPCSHRKAHNIYGQQMSRASWEGFLGLLPEKRPYLLTRATFSGGQRYAAVWTGDNVSDWEHLQLANVQCQRLSISGFSFCGSDIGGFAGNTDGELFVRWLQLSVFHPLMRVHSMGQHSSGDAMPAEEAELINPVFHQSDQEPWSFGEKWTQMAKKAIELRYCLLPCLYTAMWQHQQDGTPVIRPLVFADPLEPRFWEQERDFLFGEHLLISPIIQARTQRQGLFLPKGNWYYFWTGQPLQGELFVNVMPEQIPFFVREGAVLPVYPVRQWTRQKPIDELTLYAYYKNGEERSSLYEDAGEGFDYQEDKYSLKIFSTRGDEHSFTLQQEISGSFSTTYNKVKIYLVGFPVFVKNCLADGESIPIKEIRLRDRSLYTLNVSPDFKNIEWHG